MWVRVFNLHFPDKMEILSPQETWAAHFPMWVRVFQLALPRQDGNLVATRDVGCTFSHVGASFPTCTSPTRWKSCRHKRRGLHIFPCGCEFSNLHFPDKMEILSPQETWAASFPMWVRVFQLALPRQDGNLVATRDVGCKF